MTEKQIEILKWFILNCLVGALIFFVLTAVSVWWYITAIVSFGLFGTIFDYCWLD